jgi:hypothetical protein
MEIDGEQMVEQDKLNSMQKRALSMDFDTYIELRKGNMDSSINIKVLQLIISKSKSATNVAAQMLYAPDWMNLYRYGQAILVALTDTRAKFTPEERALLASEMPAEGKDEKRTVVWQLRLTEFEKLDLQRRADTEGLSMSEYVRRKLFQSESEESESDSETD